MYETNTPSLLQKDNEDEFDIPTGTLGHVTRFRNLIVEQWKRPGGGTLLEVERHLESFEERAGILDSVCSERIGRYKEGSEAHQQLLKWWQEKMHEIDAFCKQVRDWIDAQPMDVLRMGDSASAGIRSSRAGSEKSSSSSARVKLAQRKAKLAADIALQPLENQLEDEQSLIVRRKKQLELQREELETNALEEQLDNIEAGSSSSRGRRAFKNPRQQVSFAFLPDAGAVQNELPNPNPSLSMVHQYTSLPSQRPNEVNLGLPSRSFGAWTPCQQPRAEVVSQQPCSQAPNDQPSRLLAEAIIGSERRILNNQAQILLPRREPMVFSGICTDFEPFVRSFECAIESICSVPAEKYMYLEKYTSGEAQQLVQSCSGQDLGQSFVRAMKLLRDQYGGEFQIAQEHLKKLEMWPQIGSEDPKGLRELSIYLTGCANRMENTRYLDQLNSTRDLMLIVKKLPFDMRKRWREKALSSSDGGTEVTFVDLARFVDRQSRILNQAGFGDIRDKTQGKSNPVVTKKTSFATAISSDAQSVDCLFCKKGPHSLDACRSFLQKSFDDRQAFVRSNGLCFGCVSSNHRYRFCRGRLTCRICQKKHPTCLHNDVSDEVRRQQWKSKASSTPSSAESDQECRQPAGEDASCPPEKKVSIISLKSSRVAACPYKVVCPAVPVRVRAGSQGKFIETYIGLDTFATDAFIDDNLLLELGISGERTEISLTTMENTKGKLETKIVRDLQLFELSGPENYTLGHAYSKENWPFTREDSPRPEDVHSCSHLTGVPLKFVNDRIGILIGMNHPGLLKPLDVVYGELDQPYATRHLLGWALNGLLAKRENSGLGPSAFRIKVDKTEDELIGKFEDLLAQDFRDPSSGLRALSAEDKQWKEMVASSFVQRPDGHFQVGLPFRDDVFLPNNYYQVNRRFNSLRRRFARDDAYRTDYSAFMADLLQMGYMEEVPEEEYNMKEGMVYFLTHHAVYHKQKKKIRVVFDCSLKFHGRSFNDHLLQGPDLTSSLIGVLLRFREHRFAISGDIEKMFLQLKLPPEQANFQRIMWFPDGDPAQEPKQYRLTTHIFGAVSSPSCANYALRRTSDITPDSYSKRAREAVLKDFYVDDFMASVDSEDEAAELLHEVRNMLREGGFNLTGFMSNSRHVLGSVPSEQLAKNWRNIDFKTDDALPPERALGVAWMVESDSLGFKINITDQPCTRRGILSTIFSIYDPLGLAAPVILRAKLIFQRSCIRGSWDDEVGDDLLPSWMRWVSEVHLLSECTIPRCLSSPAGSVSGSQLHIFCDGSESAYGAVAYLRSIDSEGNIHCNIIMAKTRLVPLKRSTLKTIPRIELNGAKLAVELFCMLKTELTIEVEKQKFWTDSTTVLKYLNNKTARFQRFVAHRIEFITEHTQLADWQHIEGKINIADVITKGCSVPEFNRSKAWREGPTFLSLPEELWPGFRIDPCIQDNDVELKQVKLAMAAQVDESPMGRLLRSTFDWFKLKFRVAVYLRIFNILRTKKRHEGSITPEELLEAEYNICKYIQSCSFSSQIQCLQTGQLLKRDPLRKLSPKLDEKGLLRVGGRLQNAPLSESEKCPIILPKDHPVVSCMVIAWHCREGHQGRQHLLASLRRRFWIIGGNGLIRRLVGACIACRRRNSRPGEQFMASLPEERLMGCQPPFSAVGIDYFGPFYIRLRRNSRVKRYGVVFSCLVSRAIHLEVSHTLDVDSFLEAFSRFVSRRGSPKVVRSDNGTNLSAGSRELKKELQRWSRQKLEHQMTLKGIDWRFNPPTASHMGGIYEREIRTVRKVLDAIMVENKVMLTDESFPTLLCEVEAILNNRPLTPLSDDPQDMTPLTPNHLLRLQTDIPFPACVTDKSDLYGRRRWRQIQYLADVFWKRWSREYLPLLQERQKWTSTRRSCRPGDLVLVVDQLLPRNQWCLGRVVEVNADDCGLVRSARVKVSKCCKNRRLSLGTTILERPINKLILLKSCTNL